MQLKLEKLQRVVSDVINEEKRTNEFKVEVRRAVGPTVLVTHGVELMAETANDQLDILERTGKNPGVVKTSLLLHFVNSPIAEVRKLVARLLPEALVKKLMFDKNASVRAAVAERLPSSFINEMVKKNPNDDQLRALHRKKLLAEAGLPDPKPAEKEFDLYGEFPLGDAYEGVEHPGFTDAWYDAQAHKIINGPTAYGHNLESNWEEKTVDRIVDSYSSQGIDVDYDKLLKSVYKHMEMRDEAALAWSEAPKSKSSDLDESSLKSIANRLRLEETYNPVVLSVSIQDIDDVDALLESRLSSVGYIEKFEALFSVEKGPVPNPGKKLGINESFSKITCPKTAILPEGQLRSNDERALNSYVKNWNLQRQLRGQSYQLSWSPGAESTINFHLKVA